VDEEAGWEFLRPSAAFGLWWGDAYEWGFLMYIVCDNGNAHADALCSDSGFLCYFFGRKVKDPDHEFRVFYLEPGVEDFVIKVIKDLG